MPTAKASDTSDDAEAVLLRLYRAMTPQQKLAAMCRSNEAARALSAAQIRARRGDLGEREMRLHIGALWYGPELMAQAFGWHADAQ